MLLLLLLSILAVAAVDLLFFLFFHFFTAMVFQTRSILLVTVLQLNYFYHLLRLHLQ